MNIVHALLRQSKGLTSLRLQNHLYGCFLVMEDIASGALKWEMANGRALLRGNDFTLDVEKEFGWLGIRYGFFMDRGLVLEEHAAYRNAWQTRFAEIAGMATPQAAVDATEDELLTTLREHGEFFIRALNTGALPQTLVEKAIALLEGREEQPQPQPEPQQEPQPQPQQEQSPPQEPVTTRLVHANAEKPIRQRVLSHTYRHHEHPADPRVRVRFTRRAHVRRK